MNRLSFSARWLRSIAAAALVAAIMPALAQVPYPSKANSAFTPYTTPSSKSQLGGGLPVYITNIRRLPGDRISFQIGYEFQ